jgi:hypothetical protein
MPTVAITDLDLIYILAYRGDGYIEMDINVHRFASVPKKALQILMGK